MNAHLKGAKFSATSEGRAKLEHYCMDDVCIMVKMNKTSSQDVRVATGEDSSFSLLQFASQDEYEDLWMNYEHDQYRDQDEKELPEKPQESVTPWSDYENAVSIAKALTTEVFDRSLRSAGEMVQNSKQQTEDKVESPRTTISFPSTGFGFVETSKRSFTAWPTIENFTVEVGAYKIDEYLASFDTEEDWVYAIYYQGVEERDCSDLYKYQAIYSLPTWRYPIAQATASIYFVIEVCKAKPGYCPVDVTFNYETFRHINKPGAQDFREKWLHYVLDSKINLFKTLTY